MAVQGGSGAGNMAYGFGTPGARLTRKAGLARQLMAQEQAAPPITSHAQGLASLLRSGLAGYMQGQDVRDYEAAQSAMATPRGEQPTPLPYGVQGPPRAPVDPFAARAEAVGGLEGGYKPQALAQLGAQREQYQAGQRSRAQQLQDLANQRAQGLEDYRTKLGIEQEFAAPTETFTPVQNPYGLGGVGQVSSTTGQISGYQTPAKSETETTQKRNYDIAKEQGYPGTFFQYQQDLQLARSGLIPERQPTPVMPAAPPLEAPDPQVSPLAQPQVSAPAPQVSVIPGSPAALAQEAEIRAAEKQEAAIKQKGRKETMRVENMARAGGTVVQDLGRMLELIETTELVGGMTGAMLKGIPLEANTVYQIELLKKSVLSNTSVNEIMKMKAASETGGALGQIPVAQMEKMEQLLGSLDVTQDRDMLIDNVKRVQNLWMDMVHGDPNQIQARVGQAQAGYSALTQQRADELMQRQTLSFDEMGRKIEQPIPEGITEAEIKAAMKKYRLDRNEVIQRYNEMQ